MKLVVAGVAVMAAMAAGMMAQTPAPRGVALSDLQLNDVRCLGAGVAIADGKWELRLKDAPQSKPGRGLAVTPINAGWCTLVLMKGNDNWAVDAWRYTINPPPGAEAPVLLPKPGYPGRGGG